MSRPATGDRMLVIRNGTMIDGSGRAPTPNDALVVEGNRIRSIGRLPESLRLDRTRTDVDVIDASGQWIMPGLIDAHTHLSYGYPQLRGEGRGRGTIRPELGVLKAAWSAQKVLRSGVTSISVPGGTWFTDVGVRDAIKLGVLEGPRMYCAGRMIITYGVNFIKMADSRSVFFLMLPQPPISTLFPYTTLVAFAGMVLMSSNWIV